VVDNPPAADLVFIADGTGIAPIRAMVRRVLERGGDRPVAVLHGARPDEPLLFRDEFEAWMRRHPRLRLDAVVTRTGRAAGENPELEALVVARYVNADTERGRHFWVCAVGDVVGRLRDTLRGAGYERRAVRYEQW
jgi:CDP-4-dehydro-6-deoxyglucose reductase